MTPLQLLLAVATLLGGASAVWYFRNEIRGWWRSKNQPPPPPAPLAQNPTRERVIDAILRSDPDDDWIRANSNVRSVASYRHDANLRLVMEHLDEGIQNDDFREPWANRHLHQHATGYWCDLYYGATLIERFVLVAVDGGRALIPIPKEGGAPSHLDTILQLDYQVGKVFDTLRNLDDYIARSGLRVSHNAV